MVVVVLSVVVIPCRGCPERESPDSVCESQNGNICIYRCIPINHCFIRAKSNPGREIPRNFPLERTWKLPIQNQFSQADWSPVARVSLTVGIPYRGLTVYCMSGQNVLYPYLEPQLLISTKLRAWFQVRITWRLLW